MLLTTDPPAQPSAATTLCVHPRFHKPFTKASKDNSKPLIWWLSLESGDREWTTKLWPGKVPTHLNNQVWWPQPTRLDINTQAQGQIWRNQCEKEKIVAKWAAIMNYFGSNLAAGRAWCRFAGGESLMLKYIARLKVNAPSSLNYKPYREH